jgi:adenosylmethionine-8-amino-7-oxononanoate aminotransferase
MDGIMKLAVEYHIWNDEPERTKFIARQESYHGATIGTLALGGHYTRRAPFLHILPTNIVHISSCNTYRQRIPDESDEAFVSRKAAELDAAFLSAGSGAVAAFVCEPIVGAAAGCVVPPPGYLSAMRAVTHAHGALFILDEVMCGMGRTGTLHAWQAEGAAGAPDLQAVGKALAAGYGACSAILVGHRVVAAQTRVGRPFTHGQTYQEYALACAAGLAVQKFIERRDLLSNVREMGVLLGDALVARLGGHRYVGDVRGKGLFWAVEFVADRESRRPFAAARQVSRGVRELAELEFGVSVYAGQGCAGEGRGDHIMVMPAFDVTEELIAMMVGRIGDAVEGYFRGWEERDGMEGEDA